MKKIVKLSAVLAAMLGLSILAGCASSSDDNGNTVHDKTAKVERQSNTQNSDHKSDGNTKKAGSWFGDTFRLP